MITRDTLDALAAAAHTTTAPEHLADISTIPIDPKQPLNKRVEQFVNAVDNPYLLRVNDTVVRITYAASGPPLSQLLEVVAHIDSS